MQSHRISIPVIPGHAKEVTLLKGNLIRTGRFMRHRGLKIVSILSAEIVNIIQGIVIIRSVGKSRLHYFIRQPAHLGRTTPKKTENQHGKTGRHFVNTTKEWNAYLGRKCANQMIRLGQKVHICDHTDEGSVRVALVERRRVHRIGITNNFVIWIAERKKPD